MPDDHEQHSRIPCGAAGRLQQLRWRSRRGLLELELLLLPFADGCLAGLTAPELDAYERLLTCEDLDIYDWLQERAPAPDAALGAIVARISTHLAAAAVR